MTLTSNGVGNKKLDSSSQQHSKSDSRKTDNKKTEDPPKDKKSEGGGSTRGADPRGARTEGSTRAGDRDPEAGKSENTSKPGQARDGKTNDSSARGDGVSLSAEAREKEPPPSSQLNLNALTGALTGTRAGETGNDPLRDELDTYLEDHSFYWLDGNRRGEVYEKQQLEPEVRDRIAEALLKYPPHVVEEILDSGMDFRLVDPDNPPTDLDPYSKKKWPGEKFTGAYSARQDGTPGNMVLNQKLLDPKYADTYGTLEDTVAHETAHFWDDMRLDTTDRLLKNGESGDASTHDPELNKMFNNYKEEFKKKRNQLGIDSKDFIRQAERDALKGGLRNVLFDGGYSLGSVEEYLSMGVEYYLGSDKDRQALKDVAPDLYDYIQNDFLARPEPQKEFVI
ncbi:MAG: hypothetical protein HY319_20700 [Armatimonadetes bacterium]|nr:hypothetical protein [Armatimonadota bacterium]